MTAKGKINASNVTTGDRIIVKLHRNDAGLFTHVTESSTKTGEGVIVTQVIGKTFRAAGQYESRGKYIVETAVGSFEAAPIQTMYLAPEEAAGIKRAHAEAITEDEDRTAAAEREAEKAEAEAAIVAEAKDQAERTAALEARVDEAFPPAIYADLLLTLAVDAKPALDTLAKVSQTLGRTLRPVLEAGVRLARTIPEGRRRHGQTKARRDALRHARKLELAGI